MNRWKKNNIWNEYGCETSESRSNLEWI